MHPVDLRKSRVKSFGRNIEAQRLDQRDEPIAHCRGRDMRYES
jgi:hypothetical protein